MKEKKYNLKNIWSFLQGNFRYKLFYSKFAFLIRPHIREQIQMRINSMDKQCYTQGQCKMCGCQTTALQMANKACDKPCYPRMLPKHTWKAVKYLEFYVEYVGYSTNRTWRLKDNKFIEKVLQSVDLDNQKTYYHGGHIK